MHHLPVTAEGSASVQYAPCAGAKRGIMQWVGVRSQEEKLDCYCDYCGVYTVGSKTLAMFGSCGLIAMQRLTA